MKLLSTDDGKVVLQPQSPEDLWRLSTLLEPGDRVTGKTERKVKVGEDDVARKTLTLRVALEKAELQGDVLRASGVTTDGLDDIPKGSHHTITVRQHDTITVEKDWLDWQLEKLREEDSQLILLLLMDREEAVFAVLRREPEILSTIRGVVQKKGIDGGAPYWQELADELERYEQRLRPRHVIVASPAFFKEYVIRLLPDELRRKTVAATISATGSAALSELVRRPEVKHVLAQERFTQESLLVEELLEAIHHDKAAYGLGEVRANVASGALRAVLVSAALLAASRDDGSYEQLAGLLRQAEKTKASVHILDTSAAAQLGKLGGIAGIRRW